MSDIGDFLDVLVDDAADFAKDELENLVKEAKSDSKVFIKHIGELTEEFVKMRALEQINNDELKELMEDLLDLNKMQYHKLAASAKVRAERIVNGISNMVIDGLLAMI
jgi:exopolyphosphatase/pppGpp-phosphohydrolase